MTQKSLLFVLFLIASASLTAAELNLPVKIADGWLAEKPTKTFISQNLYGYINGGAELFLEFGFDQLRIQRYKNSGRELELELYRMKTPRGALGIYLMKAGKEEPLREIPVRNTANKYQVIMTSGQYYIQINNFAGDTSTVSTIKSLGQKIVSQIDQEYDGNLFRYLPKENIISNSELLFCGPYSIQAIYTFGKGDPLQLNGEIFGVAADYFSDTGETYSQLIVPYPSREKANVVFTDMINNLDPYLKILELAPDHFIFKDYKDKYGLVKIENSLLSIKINLSATPNSD